MVLERQNGGGGGSAVAAASECGVGGIFLDMCFFYGRVEHKKINLQILVAVQVAKIISTRVVLTAHLTFNGTQRAVQITLLVRSSFQTTFQNASVCYLTAVSARFIIAMQVIGKVSSRVEIRILSSKRGNWYE